jgi:hypothetical protein
VDAEQLRMLPPFLKPVYLGLGTAVVVIDVVVVIPVKVVLWSSWTRRSLTVIVVQTQPKTGMSLL